MKNQDEPTKAPTPIRRDAATLDRYRPRHVWLPDRPHRGFAQTGDTAAFGDESLYPPSGLGRATLSPTRLQAGDIAPLRIAYTAGEAGLPRGTRVNFVTRGQSPLGKDFPGLAVQNPGGKEIESTKWGFKLLSQSLGEGETVRLHTRPFRWTRMAGSISMEVVFTYPGDRPEQRLPEPLIITILPGKAMRLEATLPATHAGPGPVPVLVTARDGADNRAVDDEKITIHGGREAVETLLHEGRIRAQVHPPDGSGILRVRVSGEATGRETVSNPSLRSEPAGYFIGDLHCHDFLSEATGYPDEVYRWAIEERALDFVSVVPQSHGWHDNQTWTITKYMNERYLREGRFVTLPGFEWQHSGYGDKVVHYLGGDQPYLPVDDSRYNTAAGLYRALRESDALVIGHHPSYPPESWCSSTDFEAVETDVERLVELWSMHGSSEGWDPADRPLRNAFPERQVMQVLRRGIRLGFTAGSDTHRGRPGGSAEEPYPHWGGLTGIWARDLTRRSLFDALFNRHTCALTGARILLKFRVNDALMGSEITPGDSADIRLDAWAPAPIARVEIVKNARLLRRFAPGGEECHLQVEDAPGGAAFYHARVTLSNGHLAVCSPVWMGCTEKRSKEFVP